MSVKDIQRCTALCCVAVCYLFLLLFLSPPLPRVKGQRVVAGVDRSSVRLLMMMDGRTAESENREKWSDAAG